MKIALIGSAPSSIRLAPYDNPEWTIWGCSPGAYPIVRRVDAWFELHRWEPPVIGDPVLQVPWFSPEYCAWLAKLASHDVPVYMESAVPEVPSSVAYPVADMVDKYGPYFFTSSLSWMLALALEQPGIEEIGLWGVDMSATEEYGYQRAGCHFFATIAAQRGVRIVVPPESDLLYPKPLYAIGESDPMTVKLTVRLKELRSREMNALQTIENAKMELAFVRGAIDDIEYVRSTYSAIPQLDRLTRKAPEPMEMPGLTPVPFAVESLAGRADRG